MQWLFTKKFNAFFSDFDVQFWNFFVNNHSLYESFKSKVNDIYNSSEDFQKLMIKDIDNLKKSRFFVDNDLYLNKCLDDLIEQCIYLMIAAHEGYRFEFYPGARYHTSRYINHIMNGVLTRIKVNLQAC